RAVVAIPSSLGTPCLKFPSVRAAVRGSAAASPFRSLTTRGPRSGLAPLGGAHDPSGDPVADPDRLPGHVGARADRDDLVYGENVLLSVEPARGIEPLTCGLQDRCSAF